MKIVGITKELFSDGSWAYYMAYVVNESGFYIKIQAKQFNELKKNGIIVY